MRLKKLIYSAILLLFCVNVASAQIENSRFTIKGGIQNDALKQIIEKNVSGFLTTFNLAANNDKMPNFDKNATTNDLRLRFAALWKTSPMICRDAELNLYILTRPAGGYQIRNIGVDMLNAPEKDRKQEIVLNLTYDGKIDDVFIPIKQYSDIMNNKAKVEDMSLRLMVLEFVENFRTAYNRKDIQFLENVFSEKALIVVGKKIVPQKQTDAPIQPTVKLDNFKLQVQNKEQYINGLKNVFRKNAYIDVKFSDILVVRHTDKPHIYGVMLKQDWKSMNAFKEKTYSDEGYVLLIINYKNPENPAILVRTWQPEQDVKSDGDKFQLGDFPM